MKPSNFTDFPLSSVFQKCEYEIVAQNIMIILKKKGDKFKKLTWEEYKKQRKLDHNFSEGEKKYFDKVVDYCISPEAAKLFSGVWAGVYSKLT
jgi:hypothetical protein